MAILKPHYIYVLLITCIVGIFNFGSKLKYDVTQLPKVYPSIHLKNYSLGYNNSISGSFWLNFLQNSGLCDQNESGSAAYNPGASINEILTSDLRPSRCHLSWAYHMLNVMSVLTPNFLQIYLKGGLLLSIAIDDREGAKQIFDKGLVVFPKNSELNYRAAYHYLYELQDANRAIELLQVAYDTGGPKFIPSLIASLYKETGRLALAKATLEDFLKSDPPEDSIERAKTRLNEINQLILKNAE